MIWELQITTLTTSNQVMKATKQSFQECLMRYSINLAQAVGRFNTFNKDVAYNMMINDQYLSRVSEKSDNYELKYKISDFLVRNKELADKKYFKLHLKKEEVTKEIDSYCYSIPNNKTVEKVRKPVDYYQDQLKYNNNTRIKIQEIKKQDEFKIQKVLKAKPQINKVWIFE